jgi:hypothetical protein
MLQAGRSRIRFPMRSLDFSIDLILPATLWPRGWLSLWQKSWLSFFTVFSVPPGGFWDSASNNSGPPPTISFRAHYLRILAYIVVTTSLNEPRKWQGPIIRRVMWSYIRWMERPKKPSRCLRKFVTNCGSKLMTSKKVIFCVFIPNLFYYRAWWSGGSFE